MSELSVEEAIFTTRSMRHLKPDPVPNEDLEFMVEAATMAPSAGNYQMWAFVVVTDPALIAQIGLAYAESGGIYIRDMVLANPETPAEQQDIYGQAMYTVENLSEAPAIVVACLTQPCPDNAAAATGLLGSIYPAIQNLMLAARSRGLGSVLLTLASDYCPIGNTTARPVRDIVGLPEGTGAVALIPVGYPVGAWGRPRRKDYREALHFNTWAS
ncbi:MAG: nitroreductase [Candidatus Azotimanducaceae bacterium]|jgi:nitroreductase